MFSQNSFDWDGLASSFHIISARDVLTMSEMERHQNVKDKIRWLGREEQPLALLFISHRWETLQHPDPVGRQFRATQEFLQRLFSSVQAMLVSREDRLQLVPSLTYEGTLQAEELTRRMFGFGPFSNQPACIGGQRARQIVREQFRFYRNDLHAFRMWLAVWLDYTCMPQKPLRAEEEPEFRRALSMLDVLVKSSTVVSLREADDDYPQRGWCASEFFLGSDRSFSRGLFIDMGRLSRREEVRIPDPPTTTEIMMESYRQDLTAFREACDGWLLSEEPLLDTTPPDPWSAYRDLQGSSFEAVDRDPNLFRRVLEVIRELETKLISSWLMSSEPQTLDIGREVGISLEQQGLRCSERSDMVYLGFLLARNGWIDAFRPFFRECFRTYLEKIGKPAIDNRADALPTLYVTLKPADSDLRALLSKVTPHSAGTWHSRLALRHGSSPHEQALIEQVRRTLNENPLGFSFAP